MRPSAEFGTDTYRIAIKVLSAILKETESLSHRQVTEILNCVRDLIEDYPIKFTTQS